MFLYREIAQFWAQKALSQYPWWTGWVIPWSAIVERFDNSSCWCCIVRHQRFYTSLWGCCCSRTSFFILSHSSVVVSLIDTDSSLYVNRLSTSLSSSSDGLVSPRDYHHLVGSLIVSRYTLIGIISRFFVCKQAENYEWLNYINHPMRDHN